MRPYSWWLSQKPRVRKKYTLCCGMYLSQKELNEWYKGVQKRRTQKHWEGLKKDISEKQENGEA